MCVFSSHLTQDPAPGGGHATEERDDLAHCFLNGKRCCCWVIMYNRFYVEQEETCRLAWCQLWQLPWCSMLSMLSKILLSASMRDASHMLRAQNTLQWQGVACSITIQFCCAVPTSNQQMPRPLYVSCGSEL